MKVYLNDEIVIPLINKLKVSAKEEQIEVISFLDIESNLKLLIKINEILENKIDNEIKKVAINIYKTILKRANQMMKNSNLACSKEEKKHIDKLYSDILENKPKKIIRQKKKNY